jgi:Uma2 family endonuclease
MSTATAKKLPEPTWNYARLRRHFGMIPAERILLVPRPGMATEEDLAHLHDRYGRLCELVDGVLLEKTMGTKEGLLAGLLLTYINFFLEKHDLGLALPGDAFLRLAPGLVRAPDVSVLLWESMPQGELPDEAIAPLIPDLAVEVLSKSNTPKEMQRKRRELFSKGTRLVWEVDGRTQAVKVYTGVEEFTVLGVGQTLDGGDVLPGFKLALAKLFAPRRQRRKRG